MPCVWDRGRPALNEGKMPSILGRRVVTVAYLNAPSFGPANLLIFQPIIHDLDELAEDLSTICPVTARPYNPGA